MNFKVNLFFHLYETHINPHPDSHEGGLGGVIMGKNKFALKCSTGKVKCFKTMLLFFCMENWGIKDPPSQLKGKVHERAFV